MRARSASSLSFLQRNPVLLNGFAFMLGIAAANWQWRPGGWMMAAVIVAGVCAIALAWRSRRIATATALVASVALGLLDAQIESRGFGTATLVPYSNNLLYTITGTVVRAGMVRDGTERNGKAEQFQSVDVAVETVERYGDTQQIPTALRVSVRAPALERLEYGDRVRFDAQLRQAPVFRDAGVWDRRAWLEQQGITALASVERSHMEGLPGVGGTLAGRVRDRARRSLLVHMHSLATVSPDWNWLRLSDDDVALLEAMTLGERSELDHSTALDFQRTGSFHLLVVSGMNIALFAAAVFWAMRRLPFGEVGASVLTAAFAVAYASLTDLGAPIVRAVIMAVIFLVARLFYRTEARANALGVGALAILAWRPSAMYEASFQMTFLSVFAIVVIAAPLIEMTSAKYGRAVRDLYSIQRDFSLPHEVVQFRLDLRMIGTRLRQLRLPVAPLLLRYDSPVRRAASSCFRSRCSS